MPFTAPAMASEPYNTTALRTGRATRRCECFPGALRTLQRFRRSGATLKHHPIVEDKQMKTEAPACLLSWCRAAQILPGPGRAATERRSVQVRLPAAADLVCLTGELNRG